MLPILFIVLAVTPVEPTWRPTSGDTPTSLIRFKSEMARLPDGMKPTTALSANCTWAVYLERLALTVLRLMPDNVRAAQTLAETKRFITDNCRGPGGEETKARAAVDLLQQMDGTEPSARLHMPLPFPPLPDRAGGDLGVQLVPMFATLEARLAAGGRRLEGEGRACVWASGALAAAEAAQRAGAGTEGMAAGAKVLTASVAAHCQGQALAQKEAAWTWIRENKATQPLVVPMRSPTSVWPAPDATDGAIWIVVALASFVPEAFPIIALP